VSVRPLGSTELGTRTEIKNLNSFRALERGVAYEIQRQVDLIQKGGQVVQETRGWDEARGITFPQRVKEGEDDYRYFPEPDLPPLVVEPEWVEQIRRTQPELPAGRLQRFQQQYELGSYDAAVLTLEPRVADYFEQAASQAAPKTIANWITGDLFALMNQAGLGIEEIRVKPEALAGLTRLVATGTINQNTAKSVLAEMFDSGEPADQIVARRGLKQVSDADQVAVLVEQVLAENPEQVTSYLAGKETVSRWLFGQVMRLAKGQANPQVIQQVLDERLLALKNQPPPEKM